MHKQSFLLLLVYFISLPSYFAQDIPSKEDIVAHYGFKQNMLTVEQEDIVYYTYSKGNSAPSKLVMYLQGSDPSPQFSYQIKNGEVRKLCWLHGEFQQVSEEYLFVVVEKVGFGGLINEDKIPKPKIYQTKNSLDNRVFRANEVLEALCKTNTFEKVIVYGHSEGAPVAAKLATLNTNITQLGFWGGNALPDFFDFALENRKEFYKGNLSAEESQKQIDELLESFTEEIAKDPDNTKGKGYTNKRWWSYAEPPINHLLKLDIPIFVQVATDDESAPIESTYLIPLEFARLGKTNLTYKVCVGCDHGFMRKKKDGSVERNWKKIFGEFLEWANE